MPDQTRAQLKEGDALVPEDGHAEHVFRTLLGQSAKKMLMRDGLSISLELQVHSEYLIWAINGT